MSDQLVKRLGLTARIYVLAASQVRYKLLCKNGYINLLLFVSVRSHFLFVPLFFLWHLVKAVLLPYILWDDYNDANTIFSIVWFLNIICKKAIRS